jgi:NTE family protein
MTNLTGGARGDKPARVALVLGSGGVRSAAALGIADVLKRAGLRPDLIVGCSSGALFGAAIATGMETDEALALAIELWSQDLTERRRWRAYAEMLAPRLMGFDAGFSLRDARLISRRIEQGFGNHRLERLPIPLRVVTTEASSGDSRVLAQGPLADALRASIAVPFIFPSVEIDGRRLFDGVLSDPLPVSVARDAEVVVALGFKGVLPRRIDRPSRLFGQVSTAMINNLQAAQVRAAVAAGQKIVQVELEIDRRVGLWQSSAIPRIFDAGRQAAERHLNEIFSCLAGGGAQAA